MNIAFKEWAAVDEALERGEQTILLRKGGIHENRQRFQIEHDEFLIYPTYLHQQPELLKAGFASRCRDDRTDVGSVTVRHLARVIETFVAPPFEQASSWDAFHIYSPKLIDQRLRYKPERPLHVLLVRVFRLAAAMSIPETLQYAGCRSWVVLSEVAVVHGATPVLDDVVFAETAAAIRLAFAPQS